MEYFKNTWSAAASNIPADVLLLNVETTGLRPSSSFVCMISAGFRKEDILTCHTWLAGSRRDEEALLEELRKLASPFHEICTYGGNSFAFRFLKDRRTIYSDTPIFENRKLTDLQKAFRPLLQILPLAHLKKESVENFLGFERHGVKTGKELISVYQTFERSRSADSRDALVLHAQEDIRFLCESYKLQAYLDFIHGRWEKVFFEETADSILFRVDLCTPVPAETDWENEYARFMVKDSTAQVTAGLFSGRLRYFLPGSCSDYYYLPAEDTAIHRSVAQFVDHTQRKKATPETCYINREGSFLPVPGSFSAPLFYKSYRSFPAYVQYEKEKWQQDTSLAGKYLAAILQPYD